MGPDATTSETRIIFDLAKRERISIEGFTHSTTTTPLHSLFVERMARNPTSCSDKPLVEAGSMLGFRVQKGHVERPFENGPTLVQTTWYAPELNCIALKFVSGLKEAGKPLVITNQQEVKSIEMTPPPAESFAVPVNYIERRPSEVYAEYSRIFPGAPVLQAGHDANMLDDIYSSGKPLGTPVHGDAEPAK